MPRIKYRKTVIIVALACLILVVHEYHQFWPPRDRDDQILLATSNVIKAIGTRNATALVLPDQRTAIYQPSLKNCQNAGSDIFALLMVISSPENRERRDVIRSTLGTFMDHKSSSSTGQTDEKLKLFFFVGLSSKISQDTLQEESEIYGDLVVDNLVETYLNLTLKTLRMLKWTLDNCREARYIVKIDDDVHLNVAKFIEYLEEVPEGDSGLLIAGHKYNEISIDKDPYSKWFTPKFLWPQEKLPNFVAGFCYILGMEAVPKIYNASLHSPLFHLEDVFLTGIIASKTLNMKLSHIPTILTYWVPIYSLYTTACSFQKYMVVHNVGPGHLSCWNAFNSPDFDCGLKPLFFYC